MDIFTTQLTRLQPVPIKPEKLKVKALSKDSAIRKLKEQTKEFEADEYLPTGQQIDDHHESDSSQYQQNSSDESLVAKDEQALPEDGNDDELSKTKTPRKPMPKHIDLLV
jgi:hypothetical protein